ncbi:ribonuclease catalytic domain-containing protein [Parapusillimonas granuli]|uniref:RNB domain-containing ribonuclease n=1 Tax=Parapusillimonas granuli TaxID=380911 RepID=A0A853G1F5_9BURK|nr:ribonuclease catalytic domain-containing protein [Parapusillimonas granuli]MBB5215827.1 exoribonuclease-2 [Parapusillimonas granuli]NYT51108.1 RNB domain-containing ribonuclease [Parapusillimonas granuli]
MYVLYEDSGNFKAEKIFSQSDSTMQVESESGKRSKIKNASVLFSFEQPAPAVLLEEAAAQAQALDVGFLWECAPQEEFEAAAFAEEYYGHPPSAVEKAALIFALNDAPAYFHRRGKGRYRPAPPDILAAALAAMEKKQKQAAQQQEWTDEMIAGRLPEPIARAASSFLTRPDKNSLEWKAFDAAVQQRGTSAEKLLLDLGAWPHPLALHQHRFLSTHFPKGHEFAPVQLAGIERDLPLADVEAYSVDDGQTIEVDDALSVTMQGPDVATIGVHIAVPGLAVTRDNELDKLARSRMSTVYIPGLKIPMLPGELISAFSLDAGRPRPALSLYVTANLATGELLAHETRVERIQVRENLRHHVLEPLVTEEALNDPGAQLPYGHWLRPLWRQAQHLSRQREEVRGKPENNGRVEYSFALLGPHDDPNTPVQLIPRQRNAPLDRLVAEYMILTNNLWGGMLAQYGVPGIYRSQQAGRVRMSTHALPHEAIGVPQYAWSTSPLRRYVDLVNQWQILAAAEHGVSARLVAPFKPKDADLFAIIGAFDSQYTAWGDYQSAMERYWCMRWLQQQGLATVRGTVIRDDLVRLDCAPFVTRVAALPELERGQPVLLDILGYDELALELDCRLREVITA